MKVLNVIIFYNNKNEVEKYITRLHEISNNQVDIALVINADSNNEAVGLVKIMKKRGINNIYIRNFGDNVGYLNSLLNEIKIINLEEYDYYILSNTDINYRQDSFFNLLSEKKYDSSIGCIAPSVFATKTNSYSNPHYAKRIDKKKLIRLSRVFSHPFIARLYLKLANFKASKRKRNKQLSCFVYSPHGCYMIFTRSFISRILEYEYGAKMYSEESVIGELLLKYKFKCFYDACLEVEHQESSVTGRINYKKRFAMWKASIDYLLATFY